MGTEGLTTPSKDQNNASDMSNIPSNCKVQSKVSIKTSPNNHCDVKNTPHCNSMHKAEQTSQSAVDDQSNNKNNCIDYQVRLVDII